MVSEANTRVRVHLASAASDLQDRALIKQYQEQYDKRYSAIEDEVAHVDGRPNFARIGAIGLGIVGLVGGLALGMGSSSGASAGVIEGAFAGALGSVAGGGIGALVGGGVDKFVMHRRVAPVAAEDADLRSIAAIIDTLRGSSELSH